MNKRIARTFITFLIIASLIYTNIAVAFAKSEKPLLGAEEDFKVSSIKKENSYLSYLSKFSELDYSSKSIVYNFKNTVLETDLIEFDVKAEVSGLYSLGMSYKALDTQMSSVSVGIKIDGSFPYSQMEDMKFPRMWMDEYDQIRTDDMGNEFAAQQVIYKDYYYNEAIDEAVEYGEKFLVYLTQGLHKVTLVPVDGKIDIDFFKFAAISPVDKYSEPINDSQFYSGDAITIEGEDAILKSSYFLIAKNDSSSVDVTPQSAEKNLMNYIGGGNWKSVGDTLVWETPKLEEGYYQLGFSFRQSSKIGGKSYRILTIDGETPFREAGKIGFSYGDSWQKQFFSDEKNNPYLIYFSEGTHKIALTVTAADIAIVRNILTAATTELGKLYVDMTKITGETVDVYRDYNLFSQIGDMQNRLEDIRSLLKDAGDTLLKITEEESGSNYSVIMNMVLTIDQMLNNKHKAHRYKNYYYNNYCSVSSVLQELREMPLDLDKIVLTAVGENKPFQNSSFIQQISFSLKRFIMTFIKDYTSVSSSGVNEDNSITIWVSWGRDQAQILSSLIKRSFVPERGIDVNLKLVNASVVQAILSGNGPDCFLQMTRSEPVNLAMRGVLKDLSQFDDCDKVLERFQMSADTPYRYKNGLYALPDTQNFYMMFYRKDILDEYGLEVPKTWDEFDLVTKLLMRNNMSVYLPNSPVTDVAQANVGVGSNNIFPSLLLQNDVDLYSKDGKQTNLISSDAMKVFEKWTNYYKKLKLPVSLDFYNRFRTGTTPLGINSYTLYTTLKAAAPEINGLWGMTAIPGTVKKDGSVSNASSGAGTGCVILNESKNQSGAWEFLKWWTSAETQLTYSNDLESVLGPTGRIAVSNVEALKGLSWDKNELEEIIGAWQNVNEIPEYPGSYYLSRSIYQAFWNVVNSNKNTKDMLMKYGKEANDEIERKWEQYTDR